MRCKAYDVTLFSIFREGAASDKKMTGRNKPV